MQLAFGQKVPQKVEVPLTDTIREQIAKDVAEVLIRRSGASWSVLADEHSVTGYWYVLERTDSEGRNRVLNPFALVFDELKERPIEVTRMLATAGLVVGAARPDWS